MCESMIYKRPTIYNSSVYQRYGINSQGIGIYKLPYYETEIEIGGKIYGVVKIGSQLWTNENLDLDITGSEYYGSPDFYDGKCGRLYNYSQMQQVKNYINNGWKIPEYSDWETLINFVGGYSIAGLKLKDEIDNGTNDYGLSLICAGNITPYGVRYDGGTIGFYFTDTLNGTSVYYKAVLKNTNNIPENESNVQGYKRSIRLCKNL